jgi:copper resistance protein C
MNGLMQDATTKARRHGDALERSRGLRNGWNHEGTKPRRNAKTRQSISFLRGFVPSCLIHPESRATRRASLRVSVPPWFAFCAVVAVIGSIASAHAFLDRAEPRVGETVSKSPGVVKVWFTQQPEHAFSTIQVFNAEGKEVDKKDTRTDPDDAKALDVTLPKDLPAGTYKVVWKVLSTDTHRTQGDFKFTIKP